MKQKTADWLFAIFFIFSLCLSAAAIYFTPLDLAPDEAHYWEWARRLDYAYYSKGPIIAYLIAMSVHYLGDTAFVVRLPALVCSASFSLVFYFFLRRQYNSVIAFLTWVIYRVSLVFAVQYFAITTDPPVSLLWLISLIFIYQAIYSAQSNWFIPGFITIGLATLTKYTAIILYPSVIMLCILSPVLRSHLKSKGFWIGSVLLGLVLCPVYLWNVQHDWVNFQHNAGHLSTKSGFGFRPEYFLELIAGQFGLVGPILFPLVVYCLIQGWKRFREGDQLAGVFVCGSLPLLTVCLGLSLVKRVYANWPMPAFIGGLLLAAHLISRSKSLAQRLMPWIKPAIICNVLITLIVHLPVLGITLGVPGRFLTTKKLVGWNELGSAVDFELQKQPQLNVNSGFILTDGYGMASEIAFYSKAHPQVYCANLTDRRMNQYDIWGGWENLKNKDALIIVENPQVIDKLKQHFLEIIALSTASSEPNLLINYSGDELRKIYFFLGKSYDGYAFTANGR